MKYNPIINEEIANMDAFANLHPMQPADTCQPMLKVYYDLQRALAEITGLSEFTLNPCAGAHGELTGLMIICAYHQQRGDIRRRTSFRRTQRQIPQGTATPCHRGKLRH